MKDKKKLYVLVGAVVCVVVVAGIALVGTMKKTPQPVAEVEESVLATDKVVLKDEKTPLSEEEAKEKANGTGETAAIETSHDLAYEQQLAEEMGTPMPTETATMYVLDKANMMKEKNETSKTVGTLAKGDKVQVSLVETVWSTVVTDDGTSVYVKSELLSNTPPNGKEAQVPVTEELIPETETIPTVPEEVVITDVPQTQEVPQTPPVTETPPVAGTPATPVVPGVPAGLTAEQWAALQAIGADIEPEVSLSGGENSYVPEINTDEPLPEYMQGVTFH